MDDLVPNLGVRVDTTGRKTFVFVSRFPGSRNPTRRSLGVYDTLSLDAARRKAREWHALLADGIDPAVEAKRKRREAQRQYGNLFGDIAELYYEDIQRRLRRAAEVKSYLEREFTSKWRTRPIADIRRADVLGVIDSIVKRGASASAHSALAHIRGFFNWASERFDLDANPASDIKPKRLIGALVTRDRVLTDLEIQALWRATGRMRYPAGACLRMLLLTGQRKTEVARAAWPEFDIPNAMWTVPPERFKSGSSHRVPLSRDMLALLEGLPRFAKSPFVFTTNGTKAINGFNRVKRDLDRHMLNIMRAAARLRGDDPDGVKLRPFVLHDLRRTMRTRLSSLRVPDTVAEVAVGHGRKGLQRVYDQHGYEAEVREAMELWAARLREVVSPAPANVVPLRAQGRRDG
jgi:integrase